MRNLAWAIPAIAMVTLTSCLPDDATEEFNDAPKLGNIDTPAVRISFPDGFGNAAAKCIGTDLVYSSRIGNSSATGRSLAISPGHPWCADGLLTKEDIER